MPGRDVSRPETVERSTSPGRVAGYGAVALALLAVGIAIGRSTVDTPEPQAVAPATTDASPSARPRRSDDTSRRTRSGAVRAARLAVTAFDGDVLLDSTRVRQVVGRIAAREAQAALVDAFVRASAQTRAKLGVDTIPRPVTLLRSIPAGYRVEHFTPNEATVSIWYVGIVGSGASIEPQQSWRTQIVAVTWESGEWKVRSFDSARGPTPPLSGAETASTPSDLFEAASRFTEFADGR